MLQSLYDLCLGKLDSLLERFSGRPEKGEAVSFQRHLGDPRKILLIPGESLAALTLGSVFIKATAERFPRAEVCVLTDPENACLLEHLDRVRAIACEHRGSHYLEGDFRKTAARLQEENFDWAVNLSFAAGRAETMLTHLSGARVRTGMPMPSSARYYNFLLKNPPEDTLYVARFAHLFRALQVPGPFQSAEPVIHPTDEEETRAELFLRHRRRQRNGQEFVAFCPAWKPGQKALVQNLQNFTAELTRSFSPFNLVVASNLVPENESDKLDNFNTYVHRFNNLRNMVAALKACERVVTNSTGIACLVGRLGTAVELYGFDREYIARLDKSDLKNIRLHNGWSMDHLVKQPTP